jgi:hypothetical protein
MWKNKASFGLYKTVYNFPTPSAFWKDKVSVCVQANALAWFIALF